MTIMVLRNMDMCYAIFRSDRVNIPLQYKLALLTNCNQVINSHIRYIILYTVIRLTVIWSYTI